MDHIYKLPLVLDPQPGGGWTILVLSFRDSLRKPTLWKEISVNVADALESLIEGYDDLDQPLPEVLRAGRKHLSVRN